MLELLAYHAAQKLRIHPFMISADSIKLKIPLSAMKAIKSPTRWEDIEKRKGGRVLSMKKEIRNVAVGCNRIVVDRSNENVMVDISAKILGEDYHKLISIDSIGQVCDKINQIGVIEFDSNQLINQSKMLRVDFCNDIQLSENVEEYFPQLLGIRPNRKYHVSRYKAKRNQGVAINGTQRSFKERMILYDKHLELKSNKKIRRVLTDKRIDEKFSGVMRIESNHARLKQIRDYARTSDTNLISVLSSSEKPNYTLFNKMTKQYVNSNIVTLMPGEKLFKVEKIIGRRQIISELNYDMDAITEFLRRRIKGNVSDYKKQYRDLLTQMQAEKGMYALPNQNKHVKEITELLKAS